MRPPFPYVGGKQLLADRIVALLPRHESYVEPYAGSLAVLLAKPRSDSEAVNDLDGDLVHFWRMLRERDKELEEACTLTPHARAEHRAVLDSVEEPSDDPIERARRTWVLLTQGRSGGTERDTGWRHFPRAGGHLSMPRYLKSYVDRFGPCVERLYGVTLECQPALDVIERYGRHENAVLFVDPPYVLSTRAGKAYRHEMTDEDHRDLAVALRDAKASVVLCGYPSDLYDLELYRDWDRVEMVAGTGQGDGWGNRVEVLWSNREFDRHEQLELHMEAM